jgi:hypothetical protein
LNKWITSLQVFREGKQIEHLTLDHHYSGVFGVNNIYWKSKFILELEILILIYAPGEDHKCKLN